MNILIAEDDAVTRHILITLLRQWSYKTVAADDGLQAWEIIQREDSLSMLILDWQMPGLDGVEICRRVRLKYQHKPLHIIMLTVRTGTANLVEGLGAGADDYLTKPFIAEELQARIQAGLRNIKLQTDLIARVQELQAALTKVKQLQGLLPICAHCKKVRTDQQYWQDVETYLAQHSDLRFSHGICPRCYTAMVEQINPAAENISKV